MQAIASGVLVVAGLVMAVGLLALAESVLSGARKSRLKEWAARGDRSAAVAIRLGEDPRGFAPALQAVTVFLTALAGVHAGATLQPGLGRALEQTSLLSPYGQSMATGAVALAIALATLVVGDLVPRKLAQYRPEWLARLVARPVLVLAALLGPIVTALAAAADAALRLMGIRPAGEPPVSEESIRDLMREGTRAGVFEPAENEMVQRVLRFGDRRARTLMTPRHKIVWIDLGDSPEETRRKVIGSSYSRFPVCDGGLDNLLGIVHVRDLLSDGCDVEPFRLKGHLTLPVFLYEGTQGLKILEMLKSARTHNAVVLDEYGTVEGLLTLTDLLEAIVGDIADRSGDEGPRAVRRDDGSWLLDGRLPIDEFIELLDLPPLPQGDFHTLAGLVVAHLGHIPTVGEGFDAWGLHVEVVEMDGNRVDRLLVRPLGQSGADA